MSIALKRTITILFLLYPLLVGWSLSQQHFNWVGGLLLGLGLFRLFIGGNQLLWPLTGFAILCGSLSLLLTDQIWLKMYPVFMSIGSLIIFAITLIKPPSMIERFARLVEPDLAEAAVIWTKKVTFVWCLFFAFNAMIALITVFFAPMSVWVLYNGFISYLLMAALLLAEFVLRKKHQKSTTSAHTPKPL